MILGIGKLQWIPRTRDLLNVKNLLGHRDLRTTLRYTRLIDFPPDEYHSAIAKTVEEARRLVKVKKL